MYQQIVVFLFSFAEASEEILTQTASGFKVSPFLAFGLVLVALIAFFYVKDLINTPVRFNYYFT